VTRLALPEALVHTVSATWGEVGEDWLARLPGILAACAERWALTVGAPRELSYHYVVEVVRDDGTRAILKLGVPRDDLTTEIAALRHFDGRGAVRLLDAESALGAMLLERVEPGNPLAELAEWDDERATAIAADVMQRLWRPLPREHEFPTVADWAAGLGGLRERFDGGTGPLPARLVARAEALFAELLASMGEQVLLHGDLHHDNILAATREPWLAIDPKGVAGERAYEAGALLRNLLPALLALPEPGRILTRRIDQLAELLGCERERLRAWAVAQAVLAAWWSVEDGTALDDGLIAVAELLGGRTGR
jgi:streptomycin 6-kinase